MSDRRTRTTACAGAALAAAALLVAGAGMAGDHGHEAHAGTQAGHEGMNEVHRPEHANHRVAHDREPAAANVRLLDEELVDQHGREVSFRSEVVGEHIVVMNFVYTDCTTVCPVASAIFSEVQQRLASRLGEEVLLVSLTVDPVTDRPARLHAYAEKYHARPGWLWLTGQKLTVDRVLAGLGAYTPNFRDHPAMVLVGDARTGRWTRFFGFPTPDRIMAEVNALTAARPQAVSAVPRQ